MKLTFVLFVTVFLGVVTPSSSKLLPSSCAEHFVEGHTKSGVYTIHARAWYGACRPIKVYCDMETDGGGWTLFQRRGDYEIKENFTRDWNNYRDGFGDVERDFWLGNEYLYILSNQDRVNLKIDLEDFENNTRVANYHSFQLGNDNEKYKLNVSGFHGNVNDSLAYHNGRAFATYDKDDEKNCAKQSKGGWWYRSCHLSNLNGLYRKGKYSENPRDGIEWNHWLPNYSLKRVEMKVRPINFSPHWTFKQ